MKILCFGYRPWALKIYENIKHIKNAKIVAQQHNNAISSKKNAHEIYTEFKFMKKVKSVEELVKIVQTPEFWADSWAISTLERLLNVKFKLR